MNAVLQDRAALRHQWRTPLHHVIGYAELLLEECHDTGLDEFAPRLRLMAGDGQALLRRIDAGLGASGAHPMRGMARDVEASLHRLEQALAPLRQAQMPLRHAPRAKHDLECIAQALRQMHGLLGSAPARAQAHPRAEPAPIEQPPPRAAAAGGKILIIDDDAGNRELLGRLVARSGHQARYATGGAQALALLRAEPIDVILLDLRMPDMDGHDVLRALRADAALAQLPVLMVSADGASDGVVRCIEMGAVDFLLDPIDPVILRARIGACLETRRLRLREAALQRARTQLLASISHDLRQPLQAMSLYADALRVQCSSDVMRDLVECQMQAARAAMDLLDQFSDFSAIEQGVLRSTSEPVELTALVRKVSSRLAAAHGGAISVRVYGRATWVRTDPTHIGRIVQNLLGNALRFLARAEGRDRPRVLLGVRPHRGGLCLDVVDNGPGIAPHAQQLIFEPYVQLGTGALGGRGLGLSIVAGLAKSLRLQLAPVVSRPGRGSRFRVVIPSGLCLASLPNGHAGDVRRGSAGLPTQPLGGRLLGVLEGDMPAGLALAAALESSGAKCVHCAQLEGLMQALEREIRFPDALILDLDLDAGRDGLAALALLRRACHFEVPALIVTGEPVVLPPLPASCIAVRKPLGLSAVVDALVTLWRRE